MITFIRQMQNVSGVHNFSEFQSVMCSLNPGTHCEPLCYSVL